MGQEQREAAVALQRLLTDLFDARELRRWTHEHFPERLIHELPGEAASRAELAHALVGLLARHGLIDDALFARLREAREQRRVDIDAVWQSYPQVAAARPPAPPRRHPRAWDRPSRVALQCTLAFSTIWILTRGYPGLDVSRALRTLEDGVFSFLPVFHRRWALPALSITAALCSLVFWLLSPGRDPSTRDKR